MSLAAVLLAVSSAAHAAPCVYVASAFAHDIRCIDGATGASTVVLTGANNFNPADLAIGPDGHLYIADPPPGLVWRFNLSLPQGLNNPQVIATFPTGSYPEGLAFSGSDDLFVTTRTQVLEAPAPFPSGVWKIAGAARPGALPPFSPVNVLTSPGAVGQGITFDMAGNLVYLERLSKTVRLSPPKYTSAAPVISGLSGDNIGIAVNTCGDLLVASGRFVRRYTSGGQFLGNYATFPVLQSAQYMEVDASNRLFVITIDDVKGTPSVIWRVDPVLNSVGDPITSCTSGTPVQLRQIGTAVYAGLAVAPTAHTITQRFGSGLDGRCGTTDDTLSDTSRTFNFGHHAFTLTFKGVLRCFPLQLTSVRSRPADVTFQTPTPFLSGTTGIRFSSLGGFVSEYRVETPKPVAGTDYVSTNTKDAFEVKVAFFTEDLLLNPVLGHATLNTGPYVDNIIQYFWPSGAPGTDPGESGRADDFSRFVPANQPLNPAKVSPGGVPSIFRLTSPSLSGGLRFHKGQAIRVAFTVADSRDKHILNAIARLSIVRLSPGPLKLQQVVTAGTNVSNFFMLENGGPTYVYLVDSSVLDLGVLQFTITSDVAPPQSFNVTLVP